MVDMVDYDRDSRLNVLYFNCSTRLLRLFRWPVLFGLPRPAPADTYACLIFQARLRPHISWPRRPRPSRLKSLLQNSESMKVIEMYSFYCSRFLLPALHIKMVLGMSTKSKRRKALKTLPTDLYSSFRTIITY